MAFLRFLMLLALVVWLGGLIFFALINLLGIMLILWASLLRPLFRTQDRDYRTAIHSRRNRIG